MVGDGSLREEAGRAVFMEGIQTVILRLPEGIALVKLLGCLAPHQDR